MLITLTQRQPGGAPGVPVLVNSDRILRADPAGGGATIMMSNGTRIDVAETHDELMDLIDDRHDPEARKRASEVRKRQRADRQAAEQRREADAQAERMRREAEAAQAEAERTRKAAETSALAARRALERAGLPRTSDVTPEGIDLKHPAPQPHQAAPVGTARTGDPTAQPAVGSEDYEKSRGEEKALAGAQPGGVKPAEQPKEPQQTQKPGHGRK